MKNERMFKMNFKASKSEIVKFFRQLALESRQVYSHENALNRNGYNRMIGRAEAYEKCANILEMASEPKKKKKTK